MKEPAETCAEVAGPDERAVWLGLYWVDDAEVVVVDDGPGPDGELPMSPRNPTTSAMTITTEAAAVPMGSARLVLLFARARAGGGVVSVTVNHSFQI